MPSSSPSLVQSRDAELEHDPIKGLTDIDEAHTFMGVCRLPGGKHRRLDIKVYPPDQFPFALLYFTGSGHFNRSMRLRCHKAGWHLNDKGLYR